MARFFCLGEFKSIEKEEGENEGSAVRNPALARRRGFTAARVHGLSVAVIPPPLRITVSKQAKSLQIIRCGLFSFSDNIKIFTDSQKTGE
jgi:hypothetical protein